MLYIRPSAQMLLNGILNMIFMTERTQIVAAEKRNSNYSKKYIVEDDEKHYARRREKRERERVGGRYGVFNIYLNFNDIMDLNLL